MAVSRILLDIFGLMSKKSLHSLGYRSQMLNHNRGYWILFETKLDNESPFGIKPKISNKILNAVLV